MKKNRKVRGRKPYILACEIDRVRRGRTNERASKRTSVSRVGTVAN